MMQDKDVVNYRPLIGSDIGPIELCHLQWPWVTFKVIHLLQAFSNVIFRTVVWQFTRYQLT